MTDQEFASIVNDTKKVVLSAVEKHLSARFCHAIDDVVQETYIRAYRHLVKNRFRGDSLVSTWMYEIAKNESLRMNARLTREDEKSRKLSADLPATGAAAEFCFADDEGEDVERLRTAIGSLPPKYREVLELVSNGHSERQIAERLDIKNGTVKSRLSRGRELLSRAMNGGE